VKSVPARGAWRGMTLADATGHEVWRVGREGKGKERKKAIWEEGVPKGGRHP